MELAPDRKSSKLHTVSEIQPGLVLSLGLKFLVWVEMSPLLKQWFFFMGTNVVPNLYGVRSVFLMASGRVVTSARPRFVRKPPGINRPRPRCKDRLWRTSGRFPGCLPYPCLMVFNRTGLEPHFQPYSVHKKNHCYIWIHLFENPCMWRNRAFGRRVFLMLKFSHV